MSVGRLRYFAILLAMPVLLNGVLRADETTWKMGIAKAKITPQSPMYMAGFGGRDKAAEGTLHDLWVKVLALEDAGRYRGVVITCDVCGFSRQTYETICRELKNRCGLERSQILLTYSHTHTGPALDECLQDYCGWDEPARKRIHDYTRGLERTIIEQAALALSQMTPATLWIGEGTTDFAVNRRANREPEVPAMRLRGETLNGPVDHSVPVLMAKSLDGRLQAVLFGYACHTSSLAILQWSGDYAGFTMIDLERNHPGMQAMFFQGCGGDQGAMPRHKVELTRKYGNMLSAAVEEELCKRNDPVAATLRTAFQFVDLPFERTMTADDLKDCAAKGGLYGRWAERMLKKLEAGATFPKSYPYAVQVWRLGKDHLWISLAGEPVVDYSLKYKALYGPTTWVSGFSHDLTAYIPSRRVWNEGGYEGGYLGEYGLPAMRWTSDIEDRIDGAVEQLVKTLK